MTTEAALKEYREEVRAAQTALDEAEGERKALLKRLENDYGLTTEAQAKKRLKVLEIEREELSTGIDGLVERMQRDYPLED